MYHCPNLVFHPWNSFFFSICRCCCPFSYLFHWLIHFQNFSLVVFPFGFSLTCFWISPLNCLLFILFCYLFLGRVLSWFPCLLESSMRSFFCYFWNIRLWNPLIFPCALLSGMKEFWAIVMTSFSWLVGGCMCFFCFEKWVLCFLFSLSLFYWGVLLLMWVSRHYLHVGLCFWLVFREKGSWLQ